MSYNGTVRCGYCYQQGHNRRSCPRLKKAASDGCSHSKGILARSKAQAQNRSCSFCGLTGHNRRTCKDKKSTRDQMLKITCEFRKLFKVFFQRVKLDRGAFIRHEGYDDYSGIVRDVNWEHISPHSLRAYALVLLNMKGQRRLIQTAALFGDNCAVNVASPAPRVAVPHAWDKPCSCKDHMVDEYLSSKDISQWDIKYKMKNAERVLAQLREFMRE